MGCAAVAILGAADQLLELVRRNGRGRRRRLGHRIGGPELIGRQRQLGSARTSDVTKDEVLGMIILGKVPPGATPGPGAMST